MTQRSPIYGRVGPREHPRNLLTWINGVQQGLQPIPFIQRQWDWPNPVRAIVNSDLRTWIDCLPQSALSLTIPGGQRQRDWPNPLPYRQNPALLGFAVAPQIAVQVVVSLPFNQQDWPNPQAWRQSPDLRLWVDGIPQTALSLTLPPRQTEWPNPIRTRAIDGTWLVSQQIPAAVVAAMPLNSQDWPNPQARAQNQDLRICIDGIPQTALSLTIPLRQADWPNPIRATRSIALSLGDVWQNPSLALSLVAVPNVVGELQAQAEIDVAGAGFTISESTAYDPVIAVGIVISQNPLGGTLATAGSVISVVISLGVAPIPDATQKPAGRKVRRRYIVEIDGRDFEVESVAHARALLEQAREVAVRDAPRVAERIAQERVQTNRPVHTPAPLITTDAEEIRPLVIETRRAITDIYRKASIEAEIALRLELKLKKEDDEDDDDILLLL